ncbi:MAG: hypothetical protein HY200_05580 [Nitrospirae bacterium]|nr:hypothetical protein [Nitrospirota bacterium]
MDEKWAVILTSGKRKKMSAMRAVCRIFLIMLLFSAFQEGYGAEFSDWENSGEVLTRFGENQKLKNVREWTQWAQEKLLTPYYRSKGFSTTEQIHLAALSDWTHAEKEETKSYSSAMFSVDHWKGYAFVSLTYTNLDFKEQAFGIHFELVPEALKLDQVIKRYVNQKMEWIEEGKVKRLRFILVPGDSLKETPFGKLQSQMIENDELWVDFGLRNSEEIGFVEVLTVKANPSRVPFTKNWKYDDQE